MRIDRELEVQIGTARVMLRFMDFNVGLISKLTGLSNSSVMRIERGARLKIKTSLVAVASAKSCISKRELGLIENLGPFVKKAVPLLSHQRVA